MGIIWQQCTESFTDAKVAVVLDGEGQTILGDRDLVGREGDRLHFLAVGAIIGNGPAPSYRDIAREVARQRTGVANLEILIPGEELGDIAPLCFVVSGLAEQLPALPTNG